MRIARVVLATAVMASMLVVGSASPAGAADCMGPFRYAIDNPPPPLEASDVISNSGGTLAVHTDVVVAHAVAVGTHYANAISNLSGCLASVGRALAEYTVECIQASPGVQNLTSGNPATRYASVVGGTVQVHYGNLTADADAIVACSGFSVNWDIINDILRPR
ncbi:MAG TPA: hypothetical protein VG318_16595 [Actinomycetota bacterium]|nr:hypothetical protein [Actinomycetota bacterium]